MNKLYTIITLLALLVSVHQLSAQAPNWAVNASNYQYTMTVTAFLNVEGRTLDSEQDKVGAFVGDEIRGTAPLMWVESAGRYLAFLTIYANKVDETVAFKIYDSSSGKVVSVEKTLPFALDAQHGNVFQAFSLANPALSQQAEIKSFSLADAYTHSSDIVAGQVSLMVDHDQDLSSLTPEFTLSAGAKLYLARELQLSGTQQRDFSLPITYAVLSEDESVLQTYQVSVSREVIGDGEFVTSNIITANNDGSNDFWVVQNAHRYREYVFKVSDVNGRILHESVGYNNDWGGYYKGRRLDRGKYYYSIQGKGKPTITGSILLIY